MKKKLRKATVAVLAAAMLLPGQLAMASSDSSASASGGSPVNVLAAKPANDTQGHWAEKDFAAWAGKHLITGYADGTFKPNDAITRAEFVTLINRVFNFNEEANVSFPDLASSSYAYREIKKAAAAGYISGYSDGTVRPNAPISRAEAAVILYRAFELPSQTAGADELTDVAGLPAWSKNAVATLVSEGYVSGYQDKTFRAGSKITRAEALRMMNNIAGEILTEEGTYTGLKTRNVVINKANIELKDTVIEGDLYLTEGIAEGDIKLNNVTVKGKVRAYGGGENSITVSDSTISEIYVDKKNGKIRIHTTGSTSVGQVFVLSGVKLEEDASSTGSGFGTVVVGEELPGGSTVSLSGDFEQVEVKALSAPVISLLQGAINNLVLNQNVQLNVNEGGEIKGLVINTDGTITVSGSGKVPANDKLVTAANNGGTSTGTGSSSGSSPGSGSGNSGSGEEAASKFTNVSVHDPSIIKEDDTYYVFGSHLAAAKTTDLMHWQLIDSGVTSTNVLFNDVTQELAEALDWAQTDTLWAADVIKINDLYYMYYNACKGDSPLSAMGIATSKNIEGPYENQGIFLKSGGTTAPDGSAYDATTHPNTVDPDAFYDKDGKLWLVYGSYSGGIFILQLDPVTGMPLDNEGNRQNNGFGTKLLGGNHARIEAAYINYEPDTDYYYLYTTFGGLSADGGYNMRVSRSKNPNGPFLDYEGQDMIGAKGAAGTVFDDASIEPYGVKLLGNFKYTNWNADAKFPTYGYVSAGHNSVYYEEENGKLFNIFHSRFPERGEAHEVRVHQMVMNEDGWPVVTPHRYTGETIAKVNQADLAGHYQFINHGKDITAEIKPTTVIELKADGTITGSVTGTWELADDYYAHLTIDGVLYKGVFIRQWDESTEKNVMTFSALSGQGVAVWGSQFDLLPGSKILANVQAKLDVPATTYGDLTLPTGDESGAVITWQSDKPSVLSSTGVATRPEAGAGNQKVTLTASITLGEATASASFQVTVMQKSGRHYEDGPVAQFNFEGSLKDSTGNYKAGNASGVHIDETGGTVSYDTGKSGQKAVKLDGKSGGVRLPDGLITSNEYTVSMWLKPAALTDFTAAFFGATGKNNWISFVPGGTADINQALLFQGEPWYTKAKVGSLLSADQWTNAAFAVEDGLVNVYLNGVLAYEGTDFPNVFNGTNSIFGLGVNYWDTPFNGLIDEVRIYDIALTGEEIGWVVNGEPDPNQLVESITLDTGKEVLYSGETFKAAATVLPVDAANRKLGWSSNNDSVATVDASGKVTAIADGEAVITAAAQDTSGKKASYTVIVQDGLIAHYAFEDDLSDSTAYQGDGTVTGNRINNTNDSADITYTAGVDGDAAVFNGESGIRLPDGLISRNVYSVSMWLNPSAKSNYTTSFFGAQTTDSWISYLPQGPDSMGNSTMLWSGTAWYDGVTGVKMNANEWTHVAFTVNNGTVKVYVDGVLKHSGSNFPSVFTDKNSVFGLGVNYWDVPFKGMMDEVKIYNNVLSADDVKTQFADGGFVKVNETKVDLVQGETHTLSAGIPVDWSSSADTVATIDENGVVTAVGEGTAIITAASKTNPLRADTVTVNVTATTPVFNPAEDLIVWLDFNGNANDSSDNGHNGTVKNNMVTYVAGRHAGDQAAQFQQAPAGSAPFDYIPVVLPSNLIAGDQAYTAAAWVKWNGASDSWPQAWSSIYFSDTFVSPGSTDNYYMNMGLNGDTNLFISSPAAASSVKLQADTWAHIAMTVVPGGKTTLYLNGTAIAQADSNTRTTQGFNEHFLGGNFWDKNFNGAMDEFRMYDRALSEDDIQALAEVQ